VSHHAPDACTSCASVQHVYCWGWCAFSTDALWDMEGAVVRTDALWDMERAWWSGLMPCGIWRAWWSGLMPCGTWRALWSGLMPCGTWRALFQLPCPANHVPMCSPGQAILPGRYTYPMCALMIPQPTSTCAM